MPLRRSMDLKATAGSRLLVKRENFQTNMPGKGAVALPPRAFSLSRFQASVPFSHQARMILPSSQLKSLVETVRNSWSWTMD